MKFIVTLVFSALILFASEPKEHFIAKVLENVFANISIDENFKVWCDNEQILSQIKDHSNIKTEDDCKDANLIVLENKSNITKECDNKIIFGLNYSLLSDIPSSIGAFFWKKGRPNIVIIEPRIKSRNIKISKNLEEYLEEEVW